MRILVSGGGTALVNTIKDVAALKEEGDVKLESTL